MIINELSIFTYGNKENKPIIFLHGFPYDHTMWNDQIDFLKETFFCVTYDIRGLGESSVGDGQYTMEQYVDDLIQIITELNLTKPIICGLSMGGYLAFRTVEKHYNILGGAIFLDTKAQSDTDEIKLIRANKIKQINEEGLDAFVETFVPTCFSDNYKQNKKYNEIKTQCKTNDPIGVKGALIAMLSRTDSTPFLSKIKIPTLLLAGEFDSMTPPEMMENIAKKIPNSKFKVVPNSGHMSPIENPKYVNSAIFNFLTKELK